jgi:hypothetical protein
MEEHLAQSQQKQLAQQHELRSQYNIHTLRPSAATRTTAQSQSDLAAGASASSDLETTVSATPSKVVLYNKTAELAPTNSSRKDYYYVQYRPPTDATMARKTGLQVNTPITLWEERDKFLDY